MATKTSLINKSNNDKGSISSRSNLSKGGKGSYSSPKKQRTTKDKQEEIWDVTPGNAYMDINK